MFFGPLDPCFFTKFQVDFHKDRLILLQELLALTEQFAAGAVEDCRFIPKEDAHGIPPTREDVETLTKDRLEHLELASHVAMRKDLTQDHVRSCKIMSQLSILALTSFEFKYQEDSIVSVKYA